MDGKVSSPGTGGLIKRFICDGPKLTGLMSLTEMVVEPDGSCTTSFGSMLRLPVIESEDVLRLRELRLSMQQAAKATGRSKAESDEASCPKSYHY